MFTSLHLLYLSLMYGAICIDQHVGPLVWPAKGDQKVISKLCGVITALFRLLLEELF
jgi:hypothetical protein